MQQKPSGVIARTIGFVTRHPLAALILAAILLGTTFLVAREAKSVIKTSLSFVARAVMFGFLIVGVGPSISLKLRLSPW